MHHPPCWRLLATAFLAAACVAFGCKTSKPAVQQKTPPDPLVSSKKPLEGRPQDDLPTPLARIDPQPPPPPVRERPATIPNRIDLASDQPPQVRLGPPQ